MNGDALQAPLKCTFMNHDYKNAFYVEYIPEKNPKKDPRDLTLNKSLTIKANYLIQQYNNVRM